MLPPRSIESHVIFVLYICISITFFSHCSSFITIPNVSLKKRLSYKIKFATFSYSRNRNSSNGRSRRKRHTPCNSEDFSRNTGPYQLSSKFTKQIEAPPLKQLSSPEHDSPIVTPSSLFDAQRIHEDYIERITGNLPITYTNDPKTLEKWLIDNCSSHEDSTYSLLGFDVESTAELPWRPIPINPHFFNRPATVQISTPHSSIILHLTWSQEAINDDRKLLRPLAAMLSDETIIKVGAGIDEDMLELYRWDKSLNARSRFDIGGIGSTKHQTVGLKKLVNTFLGVELEKSNNIARSDWSQIPLTQKQIHYASRDAWAGAAVMDFIPKACNDNSLHISSIASLINERERNMVDMDTRARVRKEVKSQLKRMKERYDPLIKIMPDEAIEKEIKRLRTIMADTAPDGLILFDMDSFGLNFTSKSQ